MTEATYTVTVRVPDGDDPEDLTMDIRAAIEDEGLEVVHITISPN